MRQLSPDAADPTTTSVLVLWDLDLTLLHPAGFGSRMIAPALADLLGREPVMNVPFAGRTDRAILTELLSANGVTEPDDDEVSALLNAVAERCEQNGQDLLDADGGPLPGALEAVRTLSSVDGVHQGIVTGNMRRTALLKLRLCGFDGLLDPELAAYGDGPSRPRTHGPRRDCRRSLSRTRGGGKQFGDRGRHDPRRPGRAGCRSPLHRRGHRASRRGSVAGRWRPRRAARPHRPGRSQCSARLRPPHG